MNDVSVVEERIRLLDDELTSKSLGASMNVGWLTTTTLSLFSKARSKMGRAVRMGARVRECAEEKAWPHLHNSNQSLQS